MASSVFILGGARSGKSRFAVSAAAASGRVAFVATARAADRDMARRIARHQAERPHHWKTVEEAYDLVARLAELDDGYDAVVVDCLTLWVSNRLLRGDPDEAIVDEADALAKRIGRRATSLILVSNEVGAGVHPETATGLRFRDLLGIVNQKVATACDRVVLMVAGVPLTIKSAAPPGPPSGSTRADDARQAP
ncbi:MAG TPA: bifunctional adenosylcobinamide kinase/adenosylcobinamide-phosphate guanylyltransferase [Candidatus Limnocylindria bacterium]|nr:bifunctional adenosylcobinamide kinase/adenosylcobinamide-phosphate guanylyltransferase [Candidatus Limnocylindria bacterium]